MAHVNKYPPLSDHRSSCAAFDHCCGSTASHRRQRERRKLPLVVYLQQNRGVARSGGCPVPTIPTKFLGMPTTNGTSAYFNWLAGFETAIRSVAVLTILNSGPITSCLLVAQCTHNIIMLDTSLVQHCLISYISTPDFLQSHKKSTDIFF